MLDLPYGAIVKGLYMTLALVVFSETQGNFIFISGILVLLFARKYSIPFYLFFSIFWPVMEMVILHYANGHAWIYSHANVYNIPMYIFPLWAIVSECVLEIFEWGTRNNLWAEEM